MSKRVNRGVVPSFGVLSFAVLAFGGLAFGGLFLTSCGGDSDEDAALEVMDLDPSSGGATVVVESITADARGRLYVGDRVSGALWQIDPAAGSRSVVAVVAPRQVGDADPVKPDPAGMAFDAQGNLLIASGPFGEVLRVPAADLDAAAPGRARTFVTGVAGANSILLDPAGRLYVSGGANGNIYRVGSDGGEAEVFTKIEPFTRSVPPDGFMQTVVANGLALDSSGALLVADTARGAIWKIAIGSDGSAAAPTQMVASPMLEGVDGLALNSAGTLWGAVNEQNELVTIGPGGLVKQMFKNDSQGPLEYPAAIVFAGGSGYVVNLDRARRDNFAADGTTSLDGVGASIVVLPAAAAAASAPSATPNPMAPPISNGY
jgi:sugar lactone lactonase YvrE